MSCSSCCVGGGATLLTRKINHVLGVETKTSASFNTIRFESRDYESRVRTSRAPSLGELSIRVSIVFNGLRFIWLENTHLIHEMTARSRSHNHERFPPPKSLTMIGGGGLVRRATTHRSVVQQQECILPKDHDSKAPSVKKGLGRILRVYAWLGVNSRTCLLVCLVATCLVVSCRAANRILHALLDKYGKPPSSGFRQRPIMLHMDGENVTRLNHFVENPTHLVTDRRNHYWLDHGATWYDSLSKRREGCVPMGEWQDSHHPSCLLFHELDLNNFMRGGEEQLRLVHAGYYREVWMSRDTDGTKLALKTLRYKGGRDFDPRGIDKHRRDAVAMEQLSSSPHIVDIYGHCMNSALVEYAEQGLDDLFDESKPSKKERLKIAHDVSTALADAHNMDSKGRATIAHTDIKPDQFLLINGTYKLNDFNRAHFLSWDTERNEHCGHTVSLNEGIVSTMQCLVCVCVGASERTILTPIYLCRSSFYSGEPPRSIAMNSLTKRWMYFLLATFSTFY